MDNNIATQMFGNLQAGYEGVRYLENRIQQGELSLSDFTVLDTLIELLDAIADVTKEITVPHRIKDINANILFYIEQLKTNAINDNIEGFLYDFRYHFSSLFRILEFEVAYILEKFVNKSDYPRFYPEVGIVDHDEIAARGEAAYYKASVVLLAYNNLNYTRDCVESILKNTDDVEYELILVDNGSSDGTKEYFDSIPGAKVIHLKYNIHLVKGFNIGLMAAEGKYCAAVCNDFIFTPNWLKNLIICIESDPVIGFVSPGATSISNMQQISLPFNSKEDFQERAREYNVSNPSKWEERVVLLPNVLCCPTALLDRIGYYDTRFFRGEFLDDDISFRIRRAGYKLIYCADTVTHHYGSLTTVSDHQTNSMEEGRQTFREKYGLDAWLDARMNLAHLKIDFLHLSNVKTILGIDVKCGATLLQIKNRIWSSYDTKPHVTVCATEHKYEVDVSSISEKVLLMDHIYQLPKELNGIIDLIYIEKPLDCYSDDLDSIFSALSKVMSDNGKLIFMVNNSVSIDTLYEMLTSSHAVHNRKIYIRDMLCLQAREHGFEETSIINFVPERNSQSKQVIEDFAMFLAGGRPADKDYIESLLKSNVGMYQMNYQAARQRIQTL
ncbi:glycosyltransferase family 2 protein [Paenibacillus glucanolyticus]|uniref:glycosyltransferase family 2 protein n=1 Tax=Paenibacillus glucanolyticus TaxID=59843 RepID=UPI0034CF4A4B